MSMLAELSAVRLVLEDRAMSTLAELSAVLVVLPVLLPLATAVAAWLTRHRRAAQRIINVSGAALLCGTAVLLLLAVDHLGPLSVRAGAWPAPVGIAFVADPLAGLMVLVTAIVALAIAIYALADIDQDRYAAGFVPLMQLLLMGVCGAFLTGDLFNLFVWFEVMLMASFALLVLGGDRDQLRGAVPYVLLSLIGSGVFLMAVGLTYASVRTLDMADAAGRLSAMAAAEPALVTALASLFLLAFALKAGMFPVFSWLPASYHTPPAAVSALFAGLLTKVGIYALIRVLGVVMPPVPALSTILAVAAGLTMLTGVLGAVAARETRRILGFHIISQIGYIAVGVALLAAPAPAELRQLAAVAAVFYTVHHILVKTNLFLVAGSIRALCGSYRLAHTGGLFTRAPVLAAIFAVSALSLAGIPPLSGFWAKLLTFELTIAAGAWMLAAAAAVAGVLTAMSMVKIWNYAFWQPAPSDIQFTQTMQSPAQVPVHPSRQPESRPVARLGAARLVPMLLLAGLTLVIGFWPSWLLDMASSAAEVLVDRNLYVQGGVP